jgi:hypothetical protein
MQSHDRPVTSGTETFTSQDSHNRSLSFDEIPAEEVVEVFSDCPVSIQNSPEVVIADSVAAEAPAAGLGSEWWVAAVQLTVELGAEERVAVEVFAADQVSVALTVEE